MTDLAGRLSNLSAERRALLDLLLSRSAPPERAAAAPVLPRIEPAPEDRHQPFPLSGMQQAQWVGRMGAFQLGNVASHIYFEFESAGLDLDRLEHAWRRLVARHDMLRAIVRPDGLQQVLRDVPPYRIEVLDLRGQPPAAAEAALLKVRDGMSHAARPTDVWPLFELRATRLDPGLLRLHVSFDLLLADAWSFLLLVKEWGRLYEDPEAEAPPLDFTYRDYVLAERGLHEHEQFHASLEFWRRRLPSLPPPPDLPLATSPAAVESPRFRRWSVRLEEDVWARLSSRAGRLGLTPSGVVLAAFARVLALWSKRPRFTLNLTVFNRLPVHPQVDEILGEFTSFLFLDVEAAARPDFEGLARSLQEQVWECLDHRWVSGVRVLRELARLQGRTQGGAMPVVLTSTVGNYVAETDSHPFAWLGRLAYGITQAPQVWLDNQVWEDGGALVLDWDAVEQLFPEGLLDAMSGACGRLLHRLADDPDAWTSPSLNLLPPDQIARRAAANTTDAPLPEGLLHGLFEERAAVAPEAPAVITPRRTLTFGELARLSRRLGRRLRELGARPGSLVAVALDKGWEQVAAVLGIAQSGAAYLPTDPKLPADRFHYLLESGGARIALTRRGLEGEIPWPDGVRRLCVDDPELEGVDDAPLAPIAEPGDLAYVIFTSGSTGRPKGVMLEHCAALNTLVDVNRRFAVTSGDRVLGLSSLSFDLSVYDIFGVLGAGGSLVLPDPGAERDPAHWLALVERHGITLWNSVPALYEMFVEYLAGQGRREGLPLRLVLLSGDWIPVSLPGRSRQAAPAARLVSLGGATEAAVWSILHPIGEVDPSWRSIPYGRPMLNQRFYVLNELFEPCPEWVPGQLFIAGAGLARGYWGDEEKTRASFPLHPRSGERLYRTGDLGRYLPDGSIEFLGREDFQVKVQGFRIELGEIESVLAAHPAVRAVVAAALGEAHGRKRLVAWVVPEDPAAPPDRAELRDLAASKLPDYMVPADFVLLDELPLTANGKVDRQALPAPERASLRGEARAANGSEVAERLARVFAEVLGVQGVGADESFFAAGGDSILGIQVVNRAIEAGLEITPQQLFEHQSIAELAAVARLVRPAGADAGPVPLTPGQWELLGRSGEVSEAGGEGIWLALPAGCGPLEVRAAVERLVARHGALRLAVERDEDGSWRQEVREPGGAVPLLEMDLTGLSGDAVERAAQAILAAPFDLGAGLLLRAALLRRGDGEPARLVLAAHPLAVDDASWDRLAEEAAALCRGEGDRLSKAVPFRPRAEALAAAPAPSRPHEPELPAAAVATIRRPLLDADDTRALLGEALTAYGNEPGEILLAALAEALAATAAEPASLSEALEVHEAAPPFGEREVGPFSTRLPIAVRAITDSGEPVGPERILKTVKEMLRAGAPPALPEPAISLRWRLGGARVPGGGRLLPPAVSHGSGRALEVTCEVQAGELSVSWQSRSGAFPLARLESLDAAFERSLRALLAHCLTPGVGGFTPSDFPEADLEQDDLDRFLARFGQMGG